MQNSITRPCRVWAVRIVLSATVALLAACSWVRLGYNHGESLTYWWLNRYVDFDSAQQARVKREIEQLFAWHRETQLKDYSQLLARAQGQLSHPMAPADTMALYEDLKKRAWLVVDQTLPALADLALSLSPQQITHIERKFASNNEEYRKDNLHRDIDHRQKFRFRKTMQQAEYWFGNFNRKQETQILRASDARPLNNEAMLEQRLRRQRDVIALLRTIQAEKPSREVAIARLRNYAQTLFERDDHPDLQEFIDASRKANANLAAVIINTATPAQKARAVKNLQKWIDQFNALALRPG